MRVLGVGGRRLPVGRNRQDRLFDTENTYTFHFWQHLLDLSTYELDMGVAQFNIAANLDGQPLQLMVKQQSTGQHPPHLEHPPPFPPDQSKHITLTHDSNASVAPLPPPPPL